MQAVIYDLWLPLSSTIRGRVVILWIIDIAVCSRTALSVSTHSIVVEGMVNAAALGLRPVQLELVR